MKQLIYFFTFILSGAVLPYAATMDIFIACGAVLCCIASCFLMYADKK